MWSVGFFRFYRPARLHVPPTPTTAVFPVCATIPAFTVRRFAYLVSVAFSAFPVVLRTAGLFVSEGYIRFFAPDGLLCGENLHRPKIRYALHYPLCIDRGADYSV